MLASWQSDLDRLTRPTDLSHAELESSRIRSQQRVPTTNRGDTQQTPQQKLNQSGHADPHAYSLSDTQPGTFSSAAPSCERCLARPSDFYLPERDELLCQRCDAAVSTATATGAAAASSSSRIAVSGASAYRLSCSEAHPSTSSASSSAAIPSRNSPTRATMWCRGCNRAVCQVCAAPGGAHGQSPHHCAMFEDELQAQLSILRKTIGTDDTAVQQRKQTLAHDLRSLDSASASLASTLSSLASSSHQRTTGMLQRLNDAVEIEQVRIDQTVERLRGEVREIEEFLEMTGLQPNQQSPTYVTPSAMCTFLLHLRELLPRAHQLSSASSAAAPSTTQSATPPGSDFPSLPREASTRSSQLASFPHLLSLLRVKDSLLKFAMAGRKGLLKEQAEHEQTLQGLYAASQNEIREWMALSERLAKEVRASRQICTFCRVPLSGPAASTGCPANQRQTRLGAVNAVQVFEGSERREGDGLHFFVPA
jgi:hypothetical protein